MNVAPERDAIAIAALLTAERGRRHAFIARDVEALDALLAEELIFVHTNAVVEGKADVLAAHRAGATRYLALDASDSRAVIHGDVGIVTATIEMRLRHATRDTDSVLSVRMMGSWLKGARGWQLIAYQSTRFPDA